MPPTLSVETPYQCADKNITFNGRPLNISAVIHNNQSYVKTLNWTHLPEADPFLEYDSAAMGNPTTAESFSGRLTSVFEDDTHKCVIEEVKIESGNNDRVQYRINVGLTTAESVDSSIELRTGIIYGKHCLDV